MINKPKAFLIVSLLLTGISSTCVSQGAYAWNMVCIPGPYLSYTLNLRMIRTVTPLDILDGVIYVETETYGRIEYPSRSPLAAFTFYGTPQDHGTSATIFWSTNTNIEVDMWGYFAVGTVAPLIYDPDKYLSVACPGNGPNGYDEILI